MKKIKSMYRYLRKRYNRHIAINSRSYKVYIHGKVSTDQFVVAFRYLQYWQDAGLIITIDRTNENIGDSIAIVECFDFDKLKYKRNLKSNNLDTNSPVGFFEML